jgi:hypothetical protein
VRERVSERERERERGRKEEEEEEEGCTIINFYSKYRGGWGLILSGSGLATLRLRLRHY